MSNRFKVIMLCILPILYVELIWWFNSRSFSLLQLVAVSLLSLSAEFLPTVITTLRKANRDLKLVITGWVVIFSAIIYFVTVDSWYGVLAYILVSLTAVLFLIFCDLIISKLPSFVHFILGGVFAVLYGCLIVGSVQLIEQFSEEEFFVIVQILLVAGWWFFIWIVWRSQLSRKLNLICLPVSPSAFAGVLAFVFAGSVLGGLFVFQQYQASFFPETAPSFSANSEANPFYCGEVSRERNSSYDSNQVLQDIVTQVQRNPNITLSDIGFLAIQTDEDVWLTLFREDLLKEAERQDFAGPSNSVKYGQYEVALRAFYFHKIVEDHPDLFTEAELQKILYWFGQVNQRALTVEWVDWMYALAFGEWPKGPYLNQENGAGLLAVLEKYNYADPMLEAQNAEFLKNHSFGWNNHFRNTDDSVSYQTIWINNSFFQSNLFGNASQDYVERSFEWLLLQSLPDGNLVGYNPGKLSLAGVSYFGAQLTGDARLLWLAGRAAEYARVNDLYIRPLPGINGSISMASAVPEEGSCLLYGDSGTPVRLGPLAPDKIVFRSGWQSDSTYLNLNLRFTGWHRYKATNAIVTIYKEEPLIVEALNVPSTSWLPVGRAQSRDKRIPRENLNGVLIPKTGVSRIIYWLTGFGSSWAQDPPFYATVDSFLPGHEIDLSKTSIKWNGWEQTREIYFVHDGPIVVFDEATGPVSQRSAVTWHAVVPDISKGLDGQRVLLGEGGKSEMVLYMLEEGELVDQFQEIEELNGLDVNFLASKHGSLKLATVFLPDEWVGAAVQKESLDCGDVLVVQKADQTVKVPLNRSLCSHTLQ